MRVFEFWLEIQIACEKVWMQSVLRFWIFWEEVPQIGRNGQFLVNFSPDAHLLTKFHVFCNFDHVNITILKIWNHFAIILFCKESKTAIGIKGFSFWNFDFLQPWRPLTADKKLSKNFEKNIFGLSFYFWIKIAGTMLG